MMLSQLAKWSIQVLASGFSMVQQQVISREIWQQALI